MPAFAGMTRGGWRYGSSDHRITNHESRITNHESRITNYELRITNHESRITNILRRKCNKFTRDAIIFTKSIYYAGTRGSFVLLLGISDFVISVASDIIPTKEKITY